MQNRLWPTVLSCVIALCLAQPLGLFAPGHAADEDETGDNRIVSDGPRLRLAPIMAPYQSPDGVRYQPLMVEVEVVGAVGEEKLDTEGNLRQKQACFIIPLLHDKLVETIFKLKLTSADFVGERREVLQKTLFDAAIGYVGKGFYVNLTLLGDNPPALSPASATLSVQCR